MPPESSPPPVPTPPPAPPPAPLTGPPADPSQDQAYNFITNPPEPPKESSFNLLGGTTLRGRIILGAGAVMVFLVVILILRALVGGGGGNAEVLISVAQDQQVLIHLSENAGEEQTLSRKNKNLAATVQAAVSSSQSQVISYLANGGKKLKTKDLGLKISATTDERLAAASSSGTYNKTFEDVMMNELNRYGKDLQLAYKESKGPKAREILSDSFEQAKLMGVQLSSEN